MNYYRNSEEFNNLSPESNALLVRDFLNDRDKFTVLILRNNNTGKKKTKVFDKVSELYNNFLGKYFYEYYDLPSEEKRRVST